MGKGSLIQQRVQHSTLTKSWLVNPI